MYYKIIALLFICSSVAYGQNANVSFERVSGLTMEKVATINFSDITQGWSPTLTHIEPPVPGIGTKRAYLQSLKDKISAKYPKKRGGISKQSTNRSSAVQPTLMRNFAGNVFSGGPTDNDVAISKDGLLVSVANSSIHIYDVDEDTLVQTISLLDFASSLPNMVHSYDPRILYDPNEDRFIINFLDDISSENCKIIFGFSETNDPTGNWHIYNLSGTDQVDSLRAWSDFPALSITDDDLFLTINLLEIVPPQQASWQNDFVKTVIWQFKKSEAYAGNTLDYVQWKDINFNGKPIRNLIPVKGGSQIYGPNMYFLSNRNFADQNDSIFLFEVTGNTDAINATLTADLLIADLPYALAPSASSLNSVRMATNDARVLGAFYENNKIQFVSNCRDTATNMASIYHGIISDVGGSNQLNAQLISDSLLEFGYPNIAYAGNGPGDDRSLIVFEHVSPDVFPGHSAIYYDANIEDYSEIVTIKTGNSIVTIGQNPRRWGDYTGLQPVYDEPGTFWMSSGYGTTSGNFRGLSSWVSEITTELVANTEKQTVNSESAAVKTYPNPSSDYVVVEFAPTQTSIYEFNIYSTSGQLIKSIARTQVKQGANRFTFSTKPLASGNYIFTIENTDGVVHSQQITVQQ